MQQTDVHTLKGGTGFKWGRPEPLVPRWRLHSANAFLVTFGRTISSLHYDAIH